MTISATGVRVITQVPVPQNSQLVVAAAAASASSASASAAIATAQAETATTQAGIATTQAGNASSSASSAESSASSATSSANSALSSAGSASSSASSASTSASMATTQATTATDQAVISTAQAVIATTQAASASASAATATNGLLVSAGIYSSTAIGLAATTSGKHFDVKQIYGEARDFYLNSSGTAVFQNTSPLGAGEDAAKIAILERSPLVVTQYNVTPLISINSIDSLTSNGRNIKNRSVLTSPTRNIISLDTGDIRSGAVTGLTITKNYTTGPSGTGTTAQRIQIAATTNSFIFYTGVTPPAGDYRMTYKVKLNTGQGTKDMRYGNLSAGLTTVSINDATWTTITHDFTASGSNYTSSSIYPGTGAAVPFDLLLDEVQLYDRDGSTIPVFANEVKGWHLKSTGGAFRGTLARSGYLLDNSSGGACGQLVATEFPSTKTFNEFTAFAAFKYETASTGQVIVTETDATLGTTGLTASIGTSSTGTIVTNPMNTGLTNINILGQGWVIVGIRVKSNSRQSFFHEIEMGTATTAFTPFQARLLRLGGQTTASPMLGKIAIVNCWDTYLSDTDVANVVKSMRERIALIGETMPTFRNFYIAEGDSRTALATNSYAFLMGNAGEFTPNLYMRNFAVSGSHASDVTARLAAVTRVVAQAALNSRNVIMSILIGTNDSSTIAASGAAAYYNASIKPIWAAYKALGVKLIACTELPAIAAGATYETERLALNALIRADAGILYDALADFASDSVMGVANSYTLYPSNWTDTLHPNAAGHLLLKPYMKAAITSLLV